MKTIVSSEAEKELIRRFIEVVNDLDRIKDIENVDSNTKQQSISSDEYRFIENGFLNCKIEIDNVLHPITQDNDIITGTCSECGVETEGTYDQNDVSYDDYLGYNTKESQKDWLCEECEEKLGVE